MLYQLNVVVLKAGAFGCVCLFLSGKRLYVAILVTLCLCSCFRRLWVCYIVYDLVGLLAFFVVCSMPAISPAL